MYHRYTIIVLLIFWILFFLYIELEFILIIYFIVHTHFNFDDGIKQYFHLILLHKDIHRSGAGCPSGSTGGWKVPLFDQQIDDVNEKESHFRAFWWKISGKMAFSLNITGTDESFSIKPGMPIKKVSLGACLIKNLWNPYLWHIMMVISHILTGEINHSDLGYYSN